MLVVELEGGTLTSSAAGLPWCLVRPRVLGCGGRERDRGRWVVVGTLLGPEGAGDCFFCEGSMLVVPPGPCGGPGWRWGMWSDSPYVENCTVDASI